MSNLTSAATVPSAEQSNSARLYAKIAWRILPVIMFAEVISYLDRINIAFAKLQMLDDLKFSESVYGLGAGLFFIGYLIFEIPSNVLMTRIGARKTLFRIMVLWGVISMAFAFVKTPTQFYVLRILLGCAEAGFYPGIVLYLTFWFPSHYRSRMTAIFYAAVPFAGLIGGLMSGWIIDNLHSAYGLSGWQWMFLIEGVPSVLFGIALLFILLDSPKDAKWLTSAELDAVTSDLAAEQARKRGHAGTNFRVGKVFTSGRAWHLAALCICQSVPIYAISFWLPSILRDAGFKTATDIALVSVLPYGLAIVSLIVVSRSADKRLERRWHAACGFIICAAGLALSTQLTGHPTLAVAVLTVAVMGSYSATTVFWSLPSLCFVGMGLAASIAFVNAVGNLGGLISPYAIGLIKDATHSTVPAILGIACVALLGAALVLALPKKLVNH